MRCGFVSQLPTLQEVRPSRYQIIVKKRERCGLEGLKREAKRGTITLIYAARDEQQNSAVVLKNVLEK